tara:strand:- start:13713 stop:14081 length:369 start_codon:yes stop_codon:yes gene_type:complete
MITPETEFSDDSTVWRSSSIRSIISPVASFGLLLILNLGGAFRTLSEMGQPGIITLMSIIILLYFLVPILGLFWGIIAYRYSDPDDKGTRLSAMFGLALNSVFLSFAAMNIASIVRQNIPAA